jgi:hypothetical protein
MKLVKTMNRFELRVYPKTEAFFDDEIDRVTDARTLLAKRGLTLSVASSYLYSLPVLL